MNLILFEGDEIDRPLPRADPRAQHILAVLRRNPGENFDAGQVDGPLGKGVLVSQDQQALTLAFTWRDAPPPLDSIMLIIGLPRPQTARDILRDATTLGVRAMHFVQTEKSEPSYAQSTLWSAGEWPRHLRTGAAQAFDTRLPEITQGQTLAHAASRPTGGATRIALDHYEAPEPLSQCHLIDDTLVVLAVGPERGWSAGDRAVLRGAGFSFAHLGKRVLRTEAACIAALAVLKSRRGVF